MSGGALAVFGGLGLSLDRMTSILEIDTDNFVAVAEPGVVTQTLQEAVEEKGLYYPPDPSSRGSCTIGGNVAENAGGPHAAKYGVTGRWVLGLEAVFADGSVAETGGKTRKDVAGYDLTALLVGSEGTLAVVTKAWLRLIAKPAVWATVLAPFPSLEAAAKARLRDPPARPRAVRLRDRGQADASRSRRGRKASPCRSPRPRRASSSTSTAPTGEEVEREVTAAGEILLECGALDVALAADEPRRRALWDVRRGIAEAILELGVSFELDLAVPRSELVPLVTRRAAARGGGASARVRVRARRRRQPPRAAPPGRRGRPRPGRLRVRRHGDLR